MKKTKTASPAVVCMLLLLTAAVVTYFGVTVSAMWDGGLTDGNEESTPLPFPRGNTDESALPLPGEETDETLPDRADGESAFPGTEPMTDRETDLPDTDGMTERETDRVTDRVTEAAQGTGAPETGMTETEKKAGLSFWAVLGAAGCAAAVAGIVLAVTNKAEKKR